MTLTLKAGPTALERLDQAIVRLATHHGFLRLSPEASEFAPAGLAALLLTEDPQRNLEVLDACVILAEAVKPRAGELSCAVADAEASPALMRRYGVARAPAVVFLRDGQFLGTLAGIRDWAEYQNEVNRLLDGPVQTRPIAIPVVAAPTPGACA